MRYTLLLEDTATETVEFGDVKQFVKQLVRFGKWVSPNNPNEKMSLDKTWAQKVVDNFNAKVVGRIAVPLSHTDQPEYNTGELTKLEVRPDGLYGTLDIRDPKAAEAIGNDLIWDVSISFDNEYVDKKTGTNVGPALLHVALVNNPYLKGMNAFEALGNQANAICLSESKEITMSVVKNVQKFDVPVKYEQDGETKEVTLTPDQEVDVPDDAAEAVRGQIADAKQDLEDKPPVQDDPSNDGQASTKPEGKNPGNKTAGAPGTGTPDEGADTSELEKELAETRKEVAEMRSEATYKQLLSDGRIVPAQKDAYMNLSTASVATVELADGKKKTLNDLLADFIAAGPKVARFGEKGTSGEENEQSPWDQLSEEEREASKLIGVSKDDFNKTNAPKE